MNGRVKTLHPKIFGGILANRENKSHIDDLKDMQGKFIDLVVVNLYPFESEAVYKNLDMDKAIEYIDIGGPSMLRAAAKNYKDIIPLCNPNQYKDFITSFNNNDGFFSKSDRKNYALEIFKLTNQYDKNIFQFLSKENDESDKIEFKLKKVDDLRYGENPHQKASFYLHENEKNHGFSIMVSSYRITIIMISKQLFQ